MGFDFSLVDVLSDRPFGGNQLAAFSDAAGVADQAMQRLAREFNFSETTFVLPPSDPSRTCRSRHYLAAHKGANPLAALAEATSPPSWPAPRWPGSAWRWRSCSPAGRGSQRTSCQSRTRRPVPMPQETW